MDNSTNAISLKPIVVPEALQQGEKFIKWDEESGGGGGIPVTLYVDKNGFYLYWIDQNQEIDLIDIGTIRDTRTGRYAKIPKDPKLRQMVTIGTGPETLDEKTVTVCCASDFVNITFTNFCCTNKMTAQCWTDTLMRLAYNLNQINGTPAMYIRKAYTKLTLLTDKNGRIPIKNVIKMFATTNKDDKRRVEMALSGCGFSCGKNDALTTEQFHYEDFFQFYRNLTQRTEIERVFNEITGAKKYLSAAQFVDFLNKTQRDPRLNEILHPYSNAARAKDIILQYEPHKTNVQKAQFSVEGFLRYLLSGDNNIMATSKYDLSDDDMDQSLAHYFINSSHNTYLTGHQLTGKSSTEIYRQCLLSGCRCVELDFWNGKTEEPVIVHGYTFVPDISAREVLEAIAESAFKTSDFPVILSFENHCNPRQQAKIANYCREIFGERLLDLPLDDYKLVTGQQLPPPTVLKRKIIIKNKKKHQHHHHHQHRRPQPPQLQQQQQKKSVEGGGGKNGPSQRQESSASDEDESTSEEDGGGGESPEGGGESASILTTTTTTTTTSVETEKVSATETEAGAEISALVNYIQPVHFSSFDTAKKKNRNYEMSSFDEKQATALLKEYPVQFVNYNKHQLSRVYPAGTRFDSSNFMPQVYWNAGCQLVALNFQTLDLAMQLNLGIFEYNLRCGYLLKPEFMRRTDRHLYPFAESTVDGIIAGTVKVTVISGQFLSDRRVGTYVEVEMYGLPADTVRKRYRTKIVPQNGINPVYGDDEVFVFKKVVLPDLASLRIVAYEESGKFIGHRILPVSGLCPGYRHANLRNELGQPLPLATLFLHIVVKDYVPDGLSDFAEALANPIKYQSDLDKRAHQLAVLTEDMDCPPPPPPTGVDDVADDPDVIPNNNNNNNISPTNCASPGHKTIQPMASEDLPPPPPPFNTYEPPLPPSVSPPQSQINDVVIRDEQIVAESFERIFDNKVVREKRTECEKKLDALRKKYEKKRTTTLQSQRSGEFGEKRTSKLINMRLVKRLSSKTVVPEQQTSGDLDHQQSSSESYAVTNNESLPRSQSERLLLINRDFIQQERDLREKYHELIYNTAEKVLKASQTLQLKTLKEQFERDTSDLMRKLQMDHREEIRALAKIHRNREQFTRVKREAVTAVVGRGVTEREKLSQLFENKRDELQRQHEEVRNILNEAREKARNVLKTEFDERLTKISSSGGGGGGSTSLVQQDVENDATG